jgi:hypothetical protein
MKRMSGACRTHGRDQKWYKILVGKSEGKTRLGRPKRRWENIRTDLRETVWEGVDWMQLGQNEDKWLVLVNTIMNLWAP